MRKLINIYKRNIALFAIVLMSINTFATNASNDGSSLVTKAEFDALTSEFNLQMDKYQSGLNAKIDNAIANYISGASGVAREIREIVIPDSVSGVVSISSRSTIDYEYVMPIMSGIYKRSDFKTSEASNRDAVFMKFTGGNGLKGKKTVITNIKDSDTTGGATAEWKGYYIDVQDSIICSGYSSNNEYGAFTNLNDNVGSWAVERCYHIQDQPLIGSETDIMSFRMINSSGGQCLNGLMWSACLNSITTDWGTNMHKYVSVLKPYDYDMFTNYDRYYNFNYNGDYMKTFAGYTFNKQVLRQYEATNTDCIQKTIGNTVSQLIDYCGTQVTRWSGSKDIANFLKNSTNANKTMYVPMVGFEEKYLKNWKQIYDGNTKDVATFEYNNHGHETGANNRAILTSKNGDRYLGLSAGYPLMKIKAGERLNYTLKFQDKTLNYVVWFSDRPFNITAHPDNDNCLTNIVGLDKASQTNKGYVVTEGEGTFTTPIYDKDGYLYLKWGLNQLDKYEIAGGELLPTANGTIEVVNKSN